MAETITQVPCKRLDWDQFEEQYKPKLNHLVDDAPYSGWMYETSGDEMEFVRQQPGNNVWTILDVDGGTIFSPGFHLVNRMGYIVTEVPYNDDEEIEVIDDDDVELYYSHLRIKEDATGKYLETGYNDMGMSNLIWDWANDHLQHKNPYKFADDMSQYEFEEHLKEQGYTIEYSEQQFPNIAEVGWLNMITMKTGSSIWAYQSNNKRIDE